MNISGLVGNFYFKYQYTVEATGTVSLGFDISVPVHLQIDTSQTSQFQPALIFNKHGPTIRVEGGKLSVHLILNLFADLF